MTTGILFICTGNICRSPLAEGIFISKANERNVINLFDVDSAGTGSWHAGDRPDPRSIEVADRHGIKLPSDARAVFPSADFDRFHHLIAMDHSHEQWLVEHGADPERVRLMRSYDAESVSAGDLDVPDPYYGFGDGFEKVYAMLDRACEGLLDDLTTGN